MTAAKIMDVIARSPGCDGQAADAVSAFSQVKMEDPPRLLRIAKSECPDVWILLPRHKWLKSWSIIEDPVVLLKRKLIIRTPFSSCGKDNSRKLWWNFHGKKVPKLGMPFCSSKTKTSYRYTWPSKWLERSRMWLPCGRN